MSTDNEPDRLNGRKSDLICLVVALIAGVSALGGGWLYAIFIAIAAAFVSLITLRAILAFTDWLQRK